MNGYPVSNAFYVHRTAAIFKLGRHSAVYLLSLGPHFKCGLLIERRERFVAIADNLRNGSKVGGYRRTGYKMDNVLSRRQHVPDFRVNRLSRRQFKGEVTAIDSSSTLNAPAFLSPSNRPMPLT